MPSMPCRGAGRIDISTGCDRNTVWIEVRDTGKGIPRKHFKTIFHPGYTTKAGMGTRSYPGENASSRSITAAGFS